MTTDPLLHACRDCFLIFLSSQNILLFQECLKTAREAATVGKIEAAPAAGPVVGYNDLCFPKTSNYGSMRKQGRRDILTKTNIKKIDDIIREHDLAQQQQQLQNCHSNSEYDYAWDVHEAHEAAHYNESSFKNQRRISRCQINAWTDKG